MTWQLLTDSVAIGFLIYGVMCAVTDRRHLRRRRPPVDDWTMR